MKIIDQPKLKFEGVNFPIVQFSSSKTYDGSKIDAQIVPKVFYPQSEPKKFQIIIEVDLVCEEFFNLQLVAMGNFQFSEVFQDEKVKKVFVNTNAPAIMFPYVRAFISVLTSNLGNITGTLTIPTQFFQGTLEEVSP